MGLGSASAGGGGALAVHTRVNVSRQLHRCCRRLASGCATCLRNASSRGHVATPRCSLGQRVEQHRTIPLGHLGLGYFGNCRARRWWRAPSPRNLPPTAQPSPSSLRTTAARPSPLASEACAFDAAREARSDQARRNGADVVTQAAHGAIACGIGGACRGCSRCWTAAAEPGSTAVPGRWSTAGATTQRGPSSRRAGLFADRSIASKRRSAHSSSFRQAAALQQLVRAAERQSRAASSRARAVSAGDAHGRLATRGDSVHRRVWHRAPVTATVGGAAPAAAASLVPCRHGAPRADRPLVPDGLSRRPTPSRAWRLNLFNLSLSMYLSEATLVSDLFPHSFIQTLTSYS